ncbi:MAG: hypothetical protein GY835_07720 [bacterium]|nr:hypothetical protein [bacterium]
MSTPFRRIKRLITLAALTAFCLSLAASVAVAENLVEDGDFELTKSGKDLRKDGKGPDWYESRKDTEVGRKLLTLSKKNIRGNKTHKAMLRASSEFNAYLSNRLIRPLEMMASASYDICIKEILPEYNRSGFFFMGGIKDKKGGPNSTGKERFVFLGFENAEEPGKINMFAREGSEKWANKTIIAENLDLMKWYTIKIEAEIPEAYYTVEVVGVTEPYDLESFYSRGKTPDKITHISFSTWNDGPGTFYVDNIVVTGD